MRRADRLEICFEEMKGGLNLFVRKVLFRVHIFLVILKVTFATVGEYNGEELFHYKLIFVDFKEFFWG